MDKDRIFFSLYILWGIWQNTEINKEAFKKIVVTLEFSMITSGQIIRIKLKIVQLLNKVGKIMIKMSLHKRHLEKDSILISPQAWSLFNLSHYENTVLNLDIVYADISDISYENMSKVVAYIGKISKKELSLLSDRFMWLQIPSHGHNGYDRKELFKNPNVMVSCVKDVYNEPIAQYCLAAYYAFNTFAFRKPGTKINTCHIVPKNPSIMIYGLGNIGNTIANVFKRAGWGKVIGVKRTIPNYYSNKDVDIICTFKESLEYLKDIDYVVNVLPETKETIGIFNEQFFEKMNSDALFCNVGRKSAVIDKDIAQAVAGNVIRGAILDAHNDYKYDSPNIILTGHKSAFSADNAESFDTYYRSQLDLFLSGKPVANRIL